MVAVFGEVTGEQALQQMYGKMSRNEEGHQILLDKPRINSQTVNFNELKALPEGSLGNEYVTFMERNVSL